MTLTEAAAYLNVSEEFVLGLLEREELTWRHRLDPQQVAEWKAANDRKRRAALDEMVALNQEMGLYD